jgi:hypothetical protein
MVSKSTQRLNPKVRELVATDRLARPPVGRLSGTQVEQLISIAQRRETYDVDVSPARALHALAEGAKPDVALPVLAEVLADRKALVAERIAAARGLRQIATPAAERALLPNVRAGNPRVQQAVLAALGQFAGTPALAALGKIEPPDDIATYTQWAFAKALIAHRNGLGGAFLGEIPFIERSRGRPDQLSPFSARTKSAKATAVALAKLRGERYGIGLADRAHSIECGRLKWEVFLNVELARSPAALGKLSERPWIAGLLAQWLPQEEALQSRYVILATPSGGAVRLDVVRADGVVVYVGKASASGAAIAFRLSDVVRAGSAPLNVVGRLTRSSIEIERAIASTSRVAVRRALAVST